MIQLNEFNLTLWIGRNVALRRREKKLSNDDIARLVGVTRTSITNLEAGRQKVPVALLYRVALALDADPRAFFPSLEEITEEQLVAVKVGGRLVEVSTSVAAEIERLIEQNTTKGVGHEHTG